ncbi:unnamed protein product, partial [Staurois parvus]
RAAAASKTNQNPAQVEAPKEIIKPVPIATPATPAASKVTTSANMTYNKAPRPFGAPSSLKTCFNPITILCLFPSICNPVLPSAFCFIPAVCSQPTSPHHIWSACHL